ncbi:hypothetical protein [uncultured Sulfitobacter sp.]|mgnify:CR=1 FL=1|uniref:hypothetical protein n=1 Tax=uncultured Sulfitobacter sp. TaxID=191468 RepID=UPI0030DA9049|tara:strand:- start:11847 stop:12407 length:561 start_codon:yes stop_codon:yes gene_type:complete
MTWTDIERFAVLDFEASSLSGKSWPIEVGISWISEGKVQTWSSLIKPDPTWDLSDWSAQSEAVHNIPFHCLKTAPKADRVAMELSEKATGRTLISDAPPFEQYWLQQLLGNEAEAPSHLIEDYHAVSFALFDGYALDVLYEKLERTKVPHRAGPDSARLASGWLIALEIQKRATGADISRRLPNDL